MQTNLGHKNNFQQYFVLIGLVHLFTLFWNIKDDFKLVNLSQESRIKVQLIQNFSDETFQGHKKQIVQSEESANHQKKEDAFLSDKTRSFERQTIAKNVDTFNKAAKGKEGSSLNLNKTKSQKKDQFKKLKLSDFAIDDSRPFRAPASESLKGLENGDPTSVGLSSTNDYVKEIQLGDFTNLNTIEYKYYGFYHRIRQKLEQYWGRSIKEKSDAIFRSGRRIASQDYVTSLQVTLNNQGEIVGVKIIGASGVRELDEAAIESFNQAGPFPNPPRDLLINGQAVIEWGFVVKS